MEDCSWMTDANHAPERDDRYLEDGIIEFINRNPLLISILTFFFGGLAFFLVGTALF
jgi:hypothetical protein